MTHTIVTSIVGPEQFIQQGGWHPPHRMSINDSARTIRFYQLLSSYRGCCTRQGHGQSRTLEVDDPEVMKKRGIVLKDYQAQAALQLANDYDSGGKGMLLAFEQGTGKTLITIGEAAQSSVHLN